jgi:hypothetical protein
MRGARDGDSRGIGAGLCTILDMNFRELIFYALRRIRVRRGAGGYYAPKANKCTQNAALRKRKPRRSGAFLVNRRTSLVTQTAGHASVAEGAQEAVARARLIPEDVRLVMAKEVTGYGVVHGLRRSDIERVRRDYDLQQVSTPASQTRQPVSQLADGGGFS